MNVPSSAPLCVFALATVMLVGGSADAQPPLSSVRDALYGDLDHAEATLRARLGVVVTIASAKMVSLASSFDTLVAALPAGEAGRLACSEIAYEPASSCDTNHATVHLLVVPVDPTGWPNLFSFLTIGDRAESRIRDAVEAVDLDGDQRRELVLTLAVTEPADPFAVYPRGDWLFVVTPGERPREHVLADVSDCVNVPAGTWCRPHMRTIEDRNRDGRPEIRILYPGPDAAEIARAAEGDERFDYEATETRVFAYDPALRRIAPSLEDAP